MWSAGGCCHVRTSEYTQKAKSIFFSKVALNIILIIAGALLISGFRRNIQHQTALYKQKANSEKVLDETIRILKESSRSMCLKQVL